MKTTITNKHNKKIVVELHEVKGSDELAIVMHGLGGKKEELHIKNLVESFLESEITTLTFDATNSYGESDGIFEEATTTNYLEDLEAVINWSKTQQWYREPFWLAGHSLGALCITIYALKKQKEVKAIAPISTVISGRMSLKAPNNKDWEKWKAEGKHTWKSNSGIMKTLKWDHYEDRLNYDLMPYAPRIKTPILLIVGEKDESTPPEHIKNFFDGIKGNKEFHIIKDAPHTFRNKEELKEIKSLTKNWIKKVMNK